MKNQTTFDKFEAQDIRAGTIVEAEEFPEANILLINSQ
jgi:tRNA-binding EMAP/Myf-like protein